MKRILILTIIICSLFLFYSSVSGTRGELYAETIPDLAGINFISIEKVKQIVTNNIIASGYTQSILTIAENENLLATTWGPIVLVKVETKTKKFNKIDYYYIVHGILSDQSIVAYSCINAITGKLLKNCYIYREYGNWYLLTGQEAAAYALDRLNIPSWIHYTVSTVLDYCSPLNFHNFDWKYKIVFEQYVRTREGMTDTIYVDPYIVAFKKEPPTHLNALHSNIYPNRLFILAPSTRTPGYKQYIGIDGLPMNTLRK